MPQDRLTIIRDEFQALTGSSGLARIREISPQERKPVDATSKYTIETRNDVTFFVIASADLHPRTVARTIRKQEIVKAALGPELGA